MGAPLTFVADTASPLYLKQEIGPDWARRVRRHQARLVVSILAYGPAPEPAPGAKARGWTATPSRLVPPLPWTIADLRRPPSKFFTSQYHGVSYHSRSWKARPWEAYRVATPGKHRKKLGDYASQEEAAWAVLKDRNPAATDSTGVTFSSEPPPVVRARRRGPRL